MTTPATATVLGGFWPQNGVNVLASISGEAADRRLVRQALGTSRGQLSQRALMTALMGVAPGATATKTISRVVAAVELGGARPIETINLINRVTTAADVTEMTQDYLLLTTLTTYGSNPIANLDRNPLGTR